MKLPLVNPTLAEVMDRRTTVGSLGFMEGDRIRCVACGHRCLLGEGKRGICKVRFNECGKLWVPHGYVAGLQCDPVEKKPFFHVYPGVDALTFGMMGCDLHCGYCQNWVTSQALRDSAAVAPLRPVTARELVDIGRHEGARLVVSSYNEPLITAEWAVDVFREAKAAGLECAFVSNGNATPEVLDFLEPWIVAYKVDLKSFDDRHYRTLGGMLENITTTIGMIHERNIWLEVVTLVIPGFNDSETELRQAARFLASINKDIPWHVTAFHKDYKMTDPDSTTPRQLMRAAEIGAEEGLHFIYAGNLPGRVGPWEDTRCPGCGETLIRRTGYLVRDYRITADGHCPRCHQAIPGVWFRRPTEARTGNDREAYMNRRPRSVAQTLAAEEPERVIGAAPMLRASALPELTAEAEQKLLELARRLIRASVSGQPDDGPAAADLTDQFVAGVFVSLKRGKHLRGCCGSLGNKPVPLGRALAHAVQRTVSEDVRFPPVQAGEIPHLNMDLWLLAPPQPVRAQGEERLQKIELGKHGVQIARGSAHALFLPSVPIEAKWDVRRYLEQLCLKANLPPGAWREPDSVLSVFEGQVVRGQLNPDSTPQEHPAPAMLSAQQLASCAAFCRDNIRALLGGYTPLFYVPGVPDGNVHGIVLTVRSPASGKHASFCRISVRPPVPLQATLFALAQSAVEALGPRRLPADFEAGVTVLCDPTVQGTLADPDLAGIEPRRHAVAVMERSRVGLVHDPRQSPAELLQSASRQARVRDGESAAVFSFETATTIAPVTVSTAPVAVRGGAERPHAVAGKFYPAEAVELRQTVDRLLEGERQTQRWGAAMVPHAGLRFSGGIAAAVLRRLELPRTIIVLGPKHTPLGVDWAVAPQETWLLPGGHVRSDFMLARQLCEAIPGLEMDAAAHEREHAIEVELPLLARLAPETRVVGIVLGHGDLDSCRTFAVGLADLLRQRKDRPLLLVSSDMNHFGTDLENRRLDALALDAMKRCDPAHLYDTVRGNHISMCGLLPAVAVMETLRLLGGMTKVEQVGYATSADVTGDKSRVVGYAGVLLD